MYSQRVIGVLVDYQSVSGSGIADGILSCIQQHRGWKIHFEQCNCTGLKNLQALNVAGILFRAYKPGLRSAIQSSGIPAVSLGEQTKLPSVEIDDRAIGQQAARYFLDRGYQHLAFCGLKRLEFSRRRLAGMSDVISVRGGHLEVPHNLPNIWGSSPKRLAPMPDTLEWLQSLPKPVGILTVEDILGNWLIEQCEQLSFRVPEDIAVLGVNNTTAICNATNPPLSSIPRANEKIGHAAAELLLALLEGKSPLEQTIKVPPLPVVTRGSTDSFAVEDADIREALHFIHRHEDSLTSVANVADNASVCRRVLERKFKSILGRTIRQEIQRVHLAKARDLLATTDMSVARITDECGFNDATRFGIVFRKIFGISPTKFRRHFR